MGGKSEAEYVGDMIKTMAKRVEVGSKWYVVSMDWISKWQKYVGFTEGEASGKEGQRGYPG